MFRTNVLCKKCHELHFSLLWIKSYNVTFYCPIFNHQMSLLSTEVVSRYSLTNRRQLHILYTQAKTWHLIVCWFSWISLNSPIFAWCDHKIVLFWSAEPFFDHIMQKVRNSGKIQLNQQTIQCTVVKWVSIIWLFGKKK